ncbi:aldehyde dehydrogenase (NADP(+)) [uncultured Desulfuromusa sp.]|uniref:aldehyde dehydrogenase (NADP(+)) n=1 Tax=uncultured Desulfuromusa sp. TaxID=219183 RepID=UPI002AA7FE0A|nr:aldehyde dehydrogenase (NADP(+)) [uncultured Desulfuromusa sp.]
MILTGQHIISGYPATSLSATFQAVNPAINECLEGDFAEGSAADVAAAVTLAAKDFDLFRHSSDAKRGELLNAIVSELLVLKDDIICRANLETGLPLPRLEGEFVRTINQLKMFSVFVQDGGYKQIHLDHAISDRQPLPRPDLRLTQIPIGPVAVFGASNFPLAFSVAGGDTASALAAGCPVVAKGHPAHPGTSELAGRAIQQALQNTGLPDTVFSLIQGSDHTVGAALVQHPEIKGVAFTGSQSGGRALFDLAAARSNPIPVFAEMGSVNPIFILPRAMREMGPDLAVKYAESLTLGVGQFCTNPGLLFAVKGESFDLFIENVNNVLAQAQPLPMLHVGIKQSFMAQLGKMKATQGVSSIVDKSLSDDKSCYASPALLVVSAEDFLLHPNLGEEVFGPSSLVIQCQSQEQMLLLAERLQGQLTATLHTTSDDKEFCRQLLTILVRKVGRLICNDFPTGVEVCAAMHHGGPYPATTDSRFSSVGTTAIKRFLRPVCFQNFNQDLLPPELQVDQED